MLLKVCLLLVGLNGEPFQNRVVLGPPRPVGSVEATSLLLEVDIAVISHAPVMKSLGVNLAPEAKS